MSLESKMASPAKGKHLQPLNTNWHNRSLSNVSATSDAATFHSAHDHPSQMELRPLSQPSTISNPHPLSPTKPLSPKLESIKMSRQDSGYSETQASSSTSTPRTSTSSFRRSSPSKSKRRTTNSSSNSKSTRPSTKRASRSSPSTAQIRTSTSGSRPSLSSRNTTAPYQPLHQQQPYKFFQFPTLTDPVPQDPDPLPTPTLPPPPPATVQYWTSDSTRRLEYAAIDAAGKGVRGFFIRLVPDCILPAGSRRTKFHCEEGDSDVGSVRRYRLSLPPEKEGASGGEVECPGSSSKPRPRGSLFRRWTGAGRGR